MPSSVLGTNPSKNPLLTHEESETLQAASCCLFHPETTGQTLNWWELCFPACPSQVHPAPVADQQQTLPTCTLLVPRGCVCLWKMADPRVGGEGTWSQSGEGKSTSLGWSPCPMTQLAGCCPRGWGQEAQGARELMLSQAGHTHSALWLCHET